MLPVEAWIGIILAMIAAFTFGYTMGNIRGAFEGKAKALEKFMEDAKRVEPEKPRDYTQED